MGTAGVVESPKVAQDVWRSRNREGVAEKSRLMGDGGWAVTGLSRGRFKYSALRRPRRRRIWEQKVLVGSASSCRPSAISQETETRIKYPAPFCDR